MTYSISVEEALPHCAATIDEVQDTKERIGQYFRTLTKEARDQALLGGVELQTIVRHGHEVETVVTYAREGQFDLLLAGYHGHSRIVDRLIGSTAQSIVRPGRADTTFGPALPVTDTGSVLADLACLAREAGAEPLARETDALVERVREGRFYVACVGQFKRGKSALINALVGQPFHYTEMLTVAPASAGSQAVDLLRTRANRLRAVERDACAYLDRLLEVNSARLKNDILQRLGDSRAQLERALRGRLKGLSTSAQYALEQARTAHTEGAEAMRSRVQTLERLRSEVDRLLPQAWPAPAVSDVASRGRIAAPATRDGGGAPLHAGPDGPVG